MYIYYMVQIKKCARTKLSSFQHHSHIHMITYKSEQNGKGKHGTILENLHTVNKCQSKT